MILEQETFDKYGYYPKNLGKYNHKIVIVKCDYCDKIVEKRFYDFVDGKTNVNKDTCSEVSCKSLKSKECSMKLWGTSHYSQSPEYLELKKQKHQHKIGDKFTFWTIIGEPFWQPYKSSGKQKNELVGRCQCVCGKIKTIGLAELRKGRSKSCGCKRVELQKPQITTHGGSNSKLYKVWGQMKRRCKEFKQCLGNYSYIARNIQVCDEWLDFTVFRDWAFTHGYKEGLHIDRIDPHKNYCPENCQWITASENAKRITEARDEIIESQKLEIVKLTEEIEYLNSLLYNQDFANNSGFS